MEFEGEGEPYSDLCRPMAFIQLKQHPWSLSSSELTVRAPPDHFVPPQPPSRGKNLEARWGSLTFLWPVLNTMYFCSQLSAS